MADDQIMVGRLVDIDRGKRIGQLDLADGKSKPAPHRCKRLVERTKTKGRAEQGQMVRAPAIIRQPFLRSCSTDRHSSTAVAALALPKAKRLAPE